MTETLYFTLIILLFTRIFGEIAARMGQTVLVGELISGVLLGALVSNAPNFFPILSTLENNEVFHAFREFGVFFLMLMAGMELAPKELLKASRRGAIITVLAIVSAALFSGLVGYFMIPAHEMKTVYIFFIAIITSITAVPVLMKTLIDLKIVQQTSSQVLISAAFFAEILSLMLLTFIIKMIETQTFPDSAGIFAIVGKVSVFFIIILLIGRIVFPLLGNLLKKVIADEFEFSALIIFALIFALISSLLEMHFLIGAFMAGLFFEHSTVDRKTFDTISSKIEGITLGFFAPIFFASIGLSVDLAALIAVPYFILALILCFFVSKLVGGSLAARYLVGMGTGTSLFVGFGLSAKGSLDLIAAKIVKETGIFEGTNIPVIDHMFSSIVMASVITTICYPIGLRLLQKYSKQLDQER